MTRFFLCRRCMISRHCPCVRPCNLGSYV